MKGVKRNFVYLTIFCLLFIFAGCQEDHGIEIEGSSVEMGSLTDRNDRALHFRVQVNNSDYVDDFKIRFIIKDKYLQDLIETEQVEVDDTFTSNYQSINTGNSVEINKLFSVDDIRKSVEKGKGVVVEIFNGDQLLDREEVELFRENIIQLVKLDPNREIENIEITNVNESIYKRAVSEATKVTDVMAIEYPKYQFSINNETYYIWIINDGFVMNKKDPFTMYTLSESSLNEIKGLIE